MREKKIKSRKSPRRRRRRQTPSRLESLKKIPWRLIPWKLALILILTFGGSFWWLRYDPAGWFRLKYIRVSGPTRHLTVEEIEELAAPTFGLPLMLLDLDEIQNRIEDHLWVRSAKLRRLLPDTLYIHVQEHLPMAVLALPQKFLISTEGVIFKKINDEENYALPVIGGLKKDSIENHLLHQRVFESLAVIHKLKTTGALDFFGLKEIQWKNNASMTLVTEKPSFKISLGTAPWQDKLDRLIYILPYIEREGRLPTHIALNVSKGIIVRYSDKKNTAL